MQWLVVVTELRPTQLFGKVYFTSLCQFMVNVLIWFCDAVWMHSCFHLLNHFQGLLVGWPFYFVGFFFLLRVPPAPPSAAMGGYTPYTEVPPNQMPMVPPPYSLYQPVQNPSGQPQDSSIPPWHPIAAPSSTSEPTGSISHIDFPSSIETTQANDATPSEADKNIFEKPNTPPPLLQVCI